MLMKKYKISIEVFRTDLKIQKISDKFVYL